MSGSRWRRLVAILGSAAFAACAFHDGKRPNGDGGMTDDADAPPDVAPECLDTSVTCVGNMLRDCTAGGSAVVTTCDYGCLDGPAHCGTFAPYGGAIMPADVTTPVGMNLALTGSNTLDTMDGKLNGTVWPGYVARTASGVKVAVFRADSISLGSGATLQFLSAPGGKPSAAFVATGDITIDGTLDGRPNMTCSGKNPGPGGFPGGNHQAAATGSGGGQVTAGGAKDESGGGGGYGGSGGAGAAGGTPAAGGMPFGDDMITLLVGGGGGGGGGQGNGGAGGGGGAAIQLVAGGTITINGVINAGGCGGAPGDADESGGGGGAGGSILVEGKTVIVKGTVAANGGGGGGGGNAANVAPTPGSPGASSANQALGGTGDANGGQGGAGSVLDGAPGNHNNQAGGGGGGVGRIRINTLDGNSDTSGSTISPQLGTRATKGKIRVQ